MLFLAIRNGKVSHTVLLLAQITTMPFTWWMLPVSSWKEIALADQAR